MTMASHKTLLTVVPCPEFWRGSYFHARTLEYGDGYPCGMGETPEAALADARKRASESIVLAFLNGWLIPNPDNCPADELRRLQGSAESAL